MHSLVECEPYQLMLRLDGCFEGCLKRRHKKVAVYFEVPIYILRKESIDRFADLALNADCAATLFAYLAPKSLFGRFTFFATTARQEVAVSDLHDGNAFACISDYGVCARASYVEDTGDVFAKLR